MSWCAASIVLWLAAGVVPTPDADAALARPLSPGAVALLIEHVDDPRTATRLGEALRDRAPGIRAAAARVANVAGIQALMPLLVDVLGEETESEAALEELDALITLDAQSDAAALAAARRLGGAVRERLALALAAARGPAALERLEALRTLELPERTWSRFLEWAGRGDPLRLAPAVAAALHARDAVLWNAVLAGAASGWARPETSDLAASLEQDDGLRPGSLRYLVLASKPGARQAAPLSTALARLLEGGAPESRSVALELLARIEGRPARDLTARLREAKPEDSSLCAEVARRKDLRQRLDTREREALQGRLGLKKGKWPELRSDEPKEPDQGKPMLLHTATGYPRGFVEDTLAVTGCAPDARWDLGGIVRRGADGRLRGVSVFRDLVGSRECEKAAGVIVLGHLNRRSWEREPGPGREEYLLLPLAPESLSCDIPSDPDPWSGPNPTGGGHIQGPRKVRDVIPRYLESARDKRVQGTVSLKAAISATGCIQDIELLRGVHPALDIEAMHAVSRWIYSPALLGGVPVPVIMTITVNFKLR